ncbi:MAG: hypothetical protein NTV43_17135 [Methylococcales bacterium]|nr:hypothetical protein [Methylococcales bacterium]
MKPEIKAIYDYLPESIHYLMTIISIESTFILINKYGGALVDVPASAKPTNKLTGLIGIDDAKKLTAIFGLTQLEIPACLKLKLLARDIAIFEDSKAGLSGYELSLKYKIGTRSIRRILNAMNRQELALIAEKKAAITAFFKPLVFSKR